LYRRFTRRQPVTTPLPQVESLLALAEGEHGADTERMLADVGRSGLHADLLRFARALAPESARLGVQLEQVFDMGAAGHRHGARSSRNAAPRRGWLRAAGSIAAGVLVAVAIWSFQHNRSLPPAGEVAATKAPVPDRIFAALGDRNERAAPNAKSDMIFRADFKSDRIFKSSEG
jgi:type VI protein secretion system component VasK